MQSLNIHLDYLITMSLPIFCWVKYEYYHTCFTPDYLKAVTRKSRLSPEDQPGTVDTSNLTSFQDQICRLACQSGTDHIRDWRQR